MPRSKILAVFCPAKRDGRISTTWHIFSKKSYRAAAFLI